MRILFLTQILPYPPDAGPRIKTWHVLRYLAERGDKVTLVTFLRLDERQYLPDVEAICHNVVTVPIHRSRLADVKYWMRSLISGRPFLIERDDLPQMRSVVNEILASGEIEVLHADQLTMTQFALTPGAFARGKEYVQPTPHQPRLVFDAHNATWTILDRLIRTAPVPLRPVLALERDRVKRYEGHLVRTYDTTMAVTTVDRSALLDAARIVEAGKDLSDRLRVIPIAIDTQKEQRIDRKPGSRTVVAVGSLHYPPNAGGIRWFIQSVFPLVQKSVPDARLVVIGKNPPADFVRAAQESQGAIEVTGYVPDLEPYLCESALMVVPVLAGGGMRVRILEAFARGIPMVTTTIGLEGIDAEPGRDILVADEPEMFAAAVSSVMTDPEIQARLADCGRALVEQRYDWQPVLRQLNEMYAKDEPNRYEG